MNRFFLVGMAGGISCILAGCSLTPSLANPIIEDHAQKQVNAFAIQPSRRMLLVKSNVNNQKDHIDPSFLVDGLLPDRAIVMCAEASPDVADDILASLAASANVQGPVANGAASAQANASLARALATSGQVVFKRSQALQLYRDIAYHLCQARANGFIDADEFNRRLESAEADVVKLLSVEVPWPYMAQVLSTDQQKPLRTKFEAAIDVDPDGIIKITVPELKTSIIKAGDKTTEAEASPPSATMPGAGTAAAGKSTPRQ